MQPPSPLFYEASSQRQDLKKVTGSMTHLPCHFILTTAFILPTRSAAHIAGKQQMHIQTQVSLAPGPRPLPLDHPASWQGHLSESAF